MFTGLIQALGNLRAVNSNQLQISCSSNLILQDLRIGDSVAIDGVCLTVEEILPQGFVAAVSPETLQRTNLGHQAATAAVVNLEASLRVGGQLGGHFVTGHVDGVGHLQALVQTADSWEMSVTAPAVIARYIIPKGSIAVSGISLTVADCNPEGTWFKVAVIPHSFTTTNLRYLQPGSPVNLEADLLGKYVEKFLRLSGRNHSSNFPLAENPSEIRSLLGGNLTAQEITPEFLAEHGFL